MWPSSRDYESLMLITAIFFRFFYLNMLETGLKATFQDYAALKIWLEYVNNVTLTWAKHVWDHPYTIEI